MNGFLFSIQEALRQIFEASKPQLASKNLDSIPAVKVLKKVNTSDLSATSASLHDLSSNYVKLDPGLVAMIHSNQGAIDTIRGQIVELRNDVDQLQTRVNHRKQSVIPPSLVSAAPPTKEARRSSKSQVTNLNPASISHHHHHHHHEKAVVPRERSSVCNLL